MPTSISGNDGVDKIKDDTLVVADAKAGQAVGFSRMQLFAAKATTSGTSVDFSPADGTGIPSWAKLVTVTLAGVSTTGSSGVLLQLGTASGIESSGYVNALSAITTALNAAASVSSGHAISYPGATIFTSGVVQLVRVDANTWSISCLASTTAPAITMSAGHKTLAGALTRIRLTNINGTDTFDAGSVSILIEGYA